MKSQNNILKTFAKYLYNDIIWVNNDGSFDGTSVQELTPFILNHFQNHIKKGKFKLILANPNDASIYERMRSNFIINAADKLDYLRSKGYAVGISKDYYVTPDEIEQS